MGPRLDVRPDAFYEAGQGLAGDVCGPAATGLDRLVAALAGAGSMAGSDAGGSAWAGEYDRAALVAVQAGQNVVNGAYRLVGLLEQSGVNHERADAASTPGGLRLATLRGSWLHDPGWVYRVGPLPSARGGSGDTPTGWGLVQHLIGYLWPDGHQDRLHAAGAGWAACTDALTAAAQGVLGPWGLISAQSAPEVEDAATALSALGGHLRELADALRVLSASCHELAQRIDELHAAVTDELFSLLEWGAGIQVVGAALSLLSFGAAEAPTQAEQAARIAASAAKIGALIEKFHTAATLALEAIPAVGRISETLTLSMRQLLGTRLAVAGVTTARALPTATRAEKTAQLTTEMRAEQRLAASAASNVTKYADKASARLALPGHLRATSNDFFRDAGSKCRDFQVTKLPGGRYRMQYFAPAHNAGYGKLYVKVVDSSGVKLSHYKDTLGPNGLIERKWILEGPP